MPSGGDVTMRPTAALIITAAGSSTRFRTSPTANHSSLSAHEGDPSTGSTSSTCAWTKKEVYRLQDSGLSVLQSSLMPFLSLSSSERTPQLVQIIVTCAPGMEARTREEVSACLNERDLVAIPGGLVCIEGGDTRQDSVRRAIEEIPVRGVLPDYVLIHDGARPWVTTDLIERTFAAAVRSGGAVPALRSHDAVKQIDSAGMICGHLDRNRVVGVQTPQIFRYPDILFAHRSARDTLYVDDTEIFMDWGGTVEAVSGDPANRKVTYRQDLDPPRTGNPVWCWGMKS